MNTERLTIMYEGQPSYDIVFEKDFTALKKELLALGVEKRRVCLITDSNVAPLHTEGLLASVKEYAKKAVMFTIPAGEEHKNLDEVKKAYAFLIEEGFDRKDLLVAVGGGVIGDMTGFIAATYLRGVDFVQIPTTLLAQSDSSIGGKTGVDFDGYKNMVGAFKMPELVYMNFAVLETLPDRQYFNGFAEVMKHGLIKDEPFYGWLIENMYEICEKKLDTVREMVYRSCLVKKSVVEIDPTEKGERALLNFGHTIGHAIEKAMNFEMLHGECVSLGCVAAAYISMKKDMISSDEYYEIRDMFVPFNLPISIDSVDLDHILKLTKSDKKMDAGKIKFVLLKGIGKAVIDTSVTDEDIMAALKEIYFEESWD